MLNDFCHFLVKEECISAENLVEAFITQAKENRSLPQIILDFKLLSEADMLQVYRHQCNNEVSFEQSCIDLGVWNDELETKLEAIIVKEIPSIFRILVDQNLITLEQITVKLDEYISNVIEDPESFGLHKAA